MMIVKANKDSEAGKMPSEELLAAMAKYNDELVKAGVLVDLAGLQSSAKGFRVRFSGNKASVIDGPFAETKELIAGYWIIKDRKSTRLNSSHQIISYAVFCLKKKKKTTERIMRQHTEHQPMSPA